MKTFFIKPVSGAKVRDPVTKQHLRTEGESKPRSTYWLRRVESREVEEFQPAAEKAAPKKAGE